jgi:DNA-binding transcriptional regulator YhcF (GntR family)
MDKIVFDMVKEMLKPGNKGLTVEDYMDWFDCDEKTVRRAFGERREYLEGEREISAV